MTEPLVEPHDAAGFPWPDPVGQHPASRADPLVDAARDVAAEILLPGAAAADADGLPRDTMAALGSAGLLGMAAPALWGGSGAGVVQWREVAETPMAADGTSWLCWSQHHALVRALVAARPSPVAPAVADLQREYLPGLVRGDLVAGVSFSHVRRGGVPAVEVERIGAGWRVRGHVDWVTAWDVADLVLVLAEHEGRIVELVIGTGDQPGLIVGSRRHTLAMAGSHTRAVEFDGLVVAGDHCLGSMDRATWSAVDDRIATQPSPACFGLCRGALAELASLSARHGELGGVVERLTGETSALRDGCYEAIDRPDTPAQHLAGLRARALELATRVATTALAARGATGLLRGGDAERRYREAAFLLAFRQRPDIRTGTISRLSQPAAADQD